MSWNLEVTGTPVAIKKAIEAETYIPAAIRASICADIDAAERSLANRNATLAKYETSAHITYGLRLMTSGHVDDSQYESKTHIVHARIS